MNIIRHSGTALIALALVWLVIGCDGGGVTTFSAGGLTYESGTFNSTGIAIMSYDGSGQRVLVTNGTQPCIRKDGKVVAFVRGADIFTINSDGTGLTNLTRNPADVVVERPSFNGDGSRLAFSQVTTTPGTSSTIRTIKSNGTDNTVLVTDGSQPAFSPVAAKVAFVRGNNIFMVNSDGTGLTQITHNDSGVSVRSPSLSSDGKHLAFASQAVSSPTWDIQLLDLNTGTSKTVIRNGAEPAFSPDGTHIAFVRNNQIFTAFAVGGGETQLTTSKSNANPSWGR